MTEKSVAPVTALITDDEDRSILRLGDLTPGTVVLFENCRCTVIQPPIPDPIHGDIWVKVEWTKSPDE